MERGGDCSWAALGWWKDDVASEADSVDRLEGCADAARTGGLGDATNSRIETGVPWLPPAGVPGMLLLPACQPSLSRCWRDGVLGFSRSALSTPCLNFRHMVSTSRLSSASALSIAATFSLTICANSFSVSARISSECCDASFAKCAKTG